MAVTEQIGRAVLKRRFEAKGLAIIEDHPIKEGAIDIIADGFDPARRVGYEILTSEAGDRVEFTPAVIAALEASIAAGDLMLFLIDEQDVEGEDELGELADRFLAELESRKPA